MKKCKNCSKQHDCSYGTGIFCSKHCQYSWIGKQVKTHICNFPKKKFKGNWKCCYCEQIFNTRNELYLHKKEYHKDLSHKGWNKGLTKNTSPIILQASITCKNKYIKGEIIGSFKGKHLSEQTKQKLSKSRKLYLQKYPNKVPYLLNHSSKMSYPEKYFYQVILKQKINAKYHLQVSIYQLDFYNEQLKKYLEIDGQQHYTDPKIIKSDQKRTLFLKENGWIGMRIRWKTYCNLSFNEKQEIIKNIKKFFQNNI